MKAEGILEHTKRVILGVGLPTSSQAFTKYR